MNIKKSAVFDLARPIIKAKESFSPKPYLCPAGKWTIGYGTTKYPSGQDVKKTDREIDEASATYFLDYSMDRVFSSVLKLLNVQPTTHQMAAFLVLCYNIGVGCRDGKRGDFADSDLLNAFNRGDLNTVSAEWLKWNKAHVDGKLVVLPGLTTRRKEELTLFKAPD